MIAISDTGGEVECDASLCVFHAPKRLDVPKVVIRITARSD